MIIFLIVAEACCRANGLVQLGQNNYDNMRG